MRVMVHMSLVSLLLTMSGEHLSENYKDCFSLFHRLKGVAPDAQLLIYKIFSDVSLRKVGWSQFGMLTLLADTLGHG